MPPPPGSVLSEGRGWGVAGGVGVLAGGMGGVDSGSWLVVKSSIVVNMVNVSVCKTKI